MAEITPQISTPRSETPSRRPTLPLEVDDTPIGGVLRRESDLRDADERMQLSHNRALRRKLDEVVAGKVNHVGDVTLANGGSATTTTVTDDRVTPDCEISLHPLTATAAAMLPKVYIRTADLLPSNAWTPRPVGQFVVNHPILAATDVQFRYSIKG